jgi:hypothetical protein
VERYYILKKKILALMESGGLANESAFSSYLAAVESMPSMSDVELGGKEAFAEFMLRGFGGTTKC